MVLAVRGPLAEGGSWSSEEVGRLRQIPTAAEALLGHWNSLDASVEWLDERQTALV